MNKIFLLSLCLICAAAYFNSLNNDFVLDDKALVVYNPVVKSPQLLPLAFKKDIYDYVNPGSARPADQVYYRPLQMLSYFLDYKIWGLEPLGFHLANTLIHLANGILLYFLLSLLFGDRRLSFFASALFLAHPIQTSAVAYISGRADLLVTFFIFLAGVSFIKFLRLSLRRFYCLSLLSAGLALLCRENGMLLFMFLALIMFVEMPKPRRYRWLLPFVFLDLLYLSLRFLVFTSGALSMPPEIHSLPLRLVNFFNLVLRYAVLLLMPLDLHLLRVTAFIKSLFGAQALLAAAFMAVYFFLIFKFCRDRLVVFGLSWFLLGLAPVLFYFDRVPLLDGALMAESWVYISSAGFFALLAYLSGAQKKIGRPVLLSFLGFYFMMTIVNNFCWKNDLVLHKRILQYTGGRNPIRQNLVREYLSYGLFDQAAGEIKKYAEYHPGSPGLDLLWGDYYYVKGQPLLAVERYKNFLAQRGGDFTVYYRLSSFYKDLGQADPAIDYGLKSFKINPYFVLNLIQLGDLYAQKKDFAQARIYYQKAYAVNPHNPALKTLIQNAH